MVTPLEQIEKYPEKCKNLLGINYEQFSALMVIEDQKVTLKSIVKT